MKAHFMTLKAAAPMLGVSYGTAIKLADAGNLKTIKVGTRYKVSAAEVKRFSEEGNYVPPSQKKEEAAHTELETNPSESTQQDNSEPSNLPPYLRGLQKQRQP